MKFEHLYRGPIHCLRCIIRDNGMRGAFNALGVTATRDFFGFSVFVSSYRFMCDSLNPNYKVNGPSSGKSRVFVVTAIQHALGNHVKHEIRHEPSHLKNYPKCTTICLKYKEFTSYIVCGG